MLTRNTSGLYFPAASSEITVLIQKGCRLEGKLQFEGTARIDGTFEGEIYTPDILIVGEGAKVKGLVTCDIAIVLGYLEGEVRAHQRVEIGKSGLVKADIETFALQVDEGAVFEGKMKMLSGPKEEESLEN